MFRRVYLSLWAVVLSAFPWSLPAAEPARNVNDSAPSESTFESTGESILAIPAAADVLDRGLRLEREQRWGEALTVYEEGLRANPSSHDIEARIDISRLYYDLARRYSDSSYRATLNSLSVSQALDLYSDVLLKIQAHYVDAPEWRKLAERGTRSLTIALSNPLFLETNLAQNSKAEIEHFRRELPTLWPRIEVHSRHSARELASAVARLCYERLRLPQTVTVLEFTCGAANALDAYSTYLTAGQLNEVYSQIEGNFVGLGVELKSSDSVLQIIKVIPDSPAHKSGIRAGDRIVAVDGRSTADLSTDQAANLLQGPEGSTVDVTVLGSSGLRRKVRVRRQQVEVPSVDGERIVDAKLGIGYLRLTCFQKTTSRDLDAALWRLHRSGMKSLIIDLRGNPGGLLTTSVDVVDKFVDKGVIVSTRGRSSQEDYTYSAHQAGTWRLPLVVLIDGDSASASEIFAGAIRDHHRGTIVGSRSYGKGSVQGIFPLNAANSGLRLTTARFYSPNGRPFSHVGVDPDRLVHTAARQNLDSDDVDGGESEVEADQGADSALEAAIMAAKEQLARR